MPAFPALATSLALAALATSLAFPALAASSSLGRVGVSHGACPRRAGSRRASRSCALACARRRELFVWHGQTKRGLSCACGICPYGSRRPSAHGSSPLPPRSERVLLPGSLRLCGNKLVAGGEGRRGPEGAYPAGPRAAVFCRAQRGKNRTRRPWRPRAARSHGREPEHNHRSEDMPRGPRRPVPARTAWPPWAPSRRRKLGTKKTWSLRYPAPWRACRPPIWMDHGRVGWRCAREVHY